MWSNIVLEDNECQPPGRCKHAVAFDGQFLYMYGGKSGTFPLKDLWKLDLRGGKWMSLKPNNEQDEWPPPLQEHTMVHFNGRLYVFGGEIGMTDEFATPLWIYSIQMNEWKKWNSSELNQRNKVGGKGLTPIGRRGHAACVYNNYMIIYGGYRDLKGSLGDLWAFHFETDSWHLFFKPLANRFYWSSNPSPSARHNHTIVQYNEHIYVYGGMYNLDAKADCWKYNFEERKWAQIKVKQGPGALRGHIACKGLGNMFILGGERDGRFIDEVWTFSFLTETFQRLVFHGCHPCARVFPACTMLPAIVKLVPKSAVETTTVSYKQSLSQQQHPHVKNTMSHQDDSYKSLAVDNDNKYWWDDDLMLGNPHPVNSCGQTQNQNPLKNINIIRDFSNRLNNHRLGNYQVLESAVVDECGLNNTVSPISAYNSNSNSPLSPDETLGRIDEEKLIEIDDIHIKHIPGILNTTRRSESVSCFQGSKNPVKKSASSVRFADFNLPNSTSDYNSMDTLIEDYKSKGSGALDGFENPACYKKNEHEIEMACFNNEAQGATSTSKIQQMSSKHEEKVQVVTTPNYLLLVGGLESHTTHLLKKPLSIWRLRVSPDLIHQQNSI